MVRTAGLIYVTLAPAIFAGIFNMLWVRLSLAGRLNVPMDSGRRLSDGRRLFGDNKTWKGFLGMVLWGAVSGLIWGALLRGRNAESFSLFYLVHPNTAPWSALSGALLGFAYAAAELPNSFFKRRLDIQPGKNPKGLWKPFFIFLDQADSVIGCLVLLRLFYAYDGSFFLIGVLIGSLTHILLNVLLYFLNLRSNMF